MFSFANHYLKYFCFLRLQEYSIIHLIMNHFMCKFSFRKKNVHILLPVHGRDKLRELTLYTPKIPQV